MLMRQDVLWVSVSVAWSIKIENSKISSFLCLINTEIEVLLRCNFGVLACRQLLCFELVLEFKLGHLLMDDLINFFFNRF
jgi:hypothetical protein